MKAPVSPTLLWIAVGIALLLLLTWAIARRARARLPESEPAPTAGAPAPELPSAAELKASAAKLAAEGRYGEAAHLLLLQAIQILASKQEPPVSRTSRELVTHFRLADRSREAFAALVATVERSLFGAVPLGREDYEACAARVQIIGQLRG